MPAESSPRELPLREAGKGRPTPSRRAAEQARKDRVRPSVSRREASRRRREQMRAQRSGERQALVSGDERNLPARDRGPVRGRVRDVVDARRNVGDFFLPAIVVAFVLTLVPVQSVRVYSAFLLYGMVLLLIVDVVVLRRRLRNDLATHFAGEDTSGALLYGTLRATQFRRLRLPRARVAVGTKLP